MARFEYQGRKEKNRNNFVSILLFLIIFVGFLLSFSFVAKQSVKEQEKTLKDALNRSVIRCYAIEGFYPESLSYLEKNYGITYDHEKFFVDYQPRGQNIVPDITVIKRQ